MQYLHYVHCIHYAHYKHCMPDVHQAQHTLHTLNTSHTLRTCIATPRHTRDWDAERRIPFQCATCMNTHTRIRTQTCCFKHFLICIFSFHPCQKNNTAKFQYGCSERHMQCKAYALSKCRYMNNCKYTYSEYSQYVCSCCAIMLDPSYLHSLVPTYSAVHILGAFRLFPLT